MSKLADIKPEKVFKYFEDISSVPRGSGNMKGIADFCVEFAKKNNLRYVRDEADNVIIYKEASEGYENADAVILQGHLDIVCQKEPDAEIDFEKDGLDIYTEGDFIKAKGTTLGGDNGIAVAMIMAILEDSTLEHPAIEAVFTTDEEIGMIGAMKLDFSHLRGTRMINIDSEDEGILTVSCAGGSDFEMVLPVSREKVQGTEIELTVKGLKGGHSGVEINSGRVNANILMARILNKSGISCRIMTIDGGDKANAIPLLCKVSIVAENVDEVIEKTRDYAAIIKEEIKSCEENFELTIEKKLAGNYDVMTPDDTKKLVFALLCAPNGVVEMSSEIDNLVQTSLNLGILKTESNCVTMHFALRSNKVSALEFLEDRLEAFASFAGMQTKAFGHYPPWEFKAKSQLQKIYKEVYRKVCGSDISVEAIHAGLECGVFASAIKGLDCISVGPEMHDIHTTSEKLSISSVGRVFEIVLRVLKELK